MCDIFISICVNEEMFLSERSVLSQTWVYTYVFVFVSTSARISFIQ